MEQRQEDPLQRLSLRLPRRKRHSRCLRRPVLPNSSFAWPFPELQW